MEVTRQGFITSVTTALAATVALPTAEVFASVTESSAGTAGRAFSSHIGSPFELLRNGSREVVILNEVVKARSCRGTEQFSLVFSAKSGAVLPEGAYRARHREMGSLDLFLTSNAKTATLRADFNLLRA